LRWNFCRQGRPCRQDRPSRQDRPLTIEVESRGISWTNRPVTIEVGFLSGSASLTMRCQSDDEVEFLQMIE
jgi:hypothetical protein